MLPHHHLPVNQRLHISTYPLPLRFNGHFPGKPGLAVFIEAKDDGGGGDNWTLSLSFNGHFPGEPGLAGVY